MGRVRAAVQVNGRSCWTLFDSGARNTYLLKSAATGLPKVTLGRIRNVALGGQINPISEACLLTGHVEGQPVELNAFLIEDLGADEKGRKIELLFGALAMQQWGIELDLKNERLDLTHYPHELVEF